MRQTRMPTEAKSGLRPKVQYSKWRLQNTKWRLYNSKWRFYYSRWRFKNSKWRLKNSTESPQCKIASLLFGVFFCHYLENLFMGTSRNNTLLFYVVVFKINFFSLYMREVQDKKSFYFFLFINCKIFVE